MLSHFANLLQNMVADADQRVEAVSLLAEQERQQVLEDWNRTTVGARRTQSFMPFSEAQVESTPDARRDQ